MPTSVEIVDPTAESEWDRTVGTSTAGSVFHSAGWARTLHETYGYKPFYFGIRVGDSLSCLVPVMEINSRLTGRRGVSLPFSDVCTPITNGSTGLEDILPHVLRTGTDRKWKSVQFRLPAGMAPFKPVARSYYTHDMDLTGGENVIFDSFDSSVRRALRKAEREGVRTVAATTPEALKQFSELNTITRKRHGLPPQPFRFFQSLYRNVIANGNGAIVIAEYADRAIAGAVFLRFGPQAVFKYGASDDRHQERRGNNLAMWEGIRWAVGQGCTSLSLGRTGMNEEGLRRFKNGWGGRESTLEYFTFNFSSHGFVTDRDRIFGWYNALFKSMPGVVLRAFGSVMYGHMG